MLAKTSIAADIDLTILSRMELDSAGEHAERAYPMLASLVAPRPIAWVTTLGPDGVVNAAPFSFFNVLGDEPPIVGFCPGDREDGTPKDTARNIRSNHQFVPGGYCHTRDRLKCAAPDKLLR